MPVGRVHVYPDLRALMSEPGAFHLARGGFQFLLCGVWVACVCPESGNWLDVNLIHSLLTNIKIGLTQLERLQVEIGSLFVVSDSDSQSDT